MNVRTLTTGIGIAVATVAMVIASAGVAQADAGSRQALDSLVTSGVISDVQLDAFKDEKNDLTDSGMTCREATSQALAALVANGTLTQDEADAIQGAKGGSLSASARSEAPVTATQTGTTQDRRQQARGGRGGRGGR